MPWTDMFKSLLGGDDEDGMTEIEIKRKRRGEMFGEEDGYSGEASPEKAMIAMEAIEREKAKPGGGSEYARSGEMKRERDAEQASIEAQDELPGAKRKLIEKLRKKFNLSYDEASSLIEKMGGVRGYYKSRGVREEEDIDRDNQTLRSMANERRAAERAASGY